MKKFFLFLMIFIFGFILGIVLGFYFFSVKNRRDSLSVKITHSLTPTPILISASITLSPSATISPTPFENNQSDLPVIRIPYKNKKDWASYVDSKDGFSFEYQNNPSGAAKFYEKIKNFKEGEYVDVFSCFTPPEGPAVGKEICSLEYGVKIYYNYNGGSRRDWLARNFNLWENCDTSLYPRYYADVYLGSNKGLLYTSECEGSFGVTYLLFPKSNKMIVIFKDGHSIDIEKKKIKISDFFYERLSTFKFE